jgi:Flp pilus assembly pilin Flp
MATRLRFLRERLCAFRAETLAQDLMEYALLAALLSLLVVAASAAVATTMNSTASKMGHKFKNHVDRGLHLGWYK